MDNDKKTITSDDIPDCDLDAFLPTDEDLDEIIKGTISATLSAQPTSVAGVEIIDITPTVVAEAETPTVISEAETPDPEVEAICKEMEELDSDFEVIRERLAKITQLAADAIESSALSARASDNAKDYAALANLINVATNANDKMMEIHVTRQKIKGAAKERRGGASTPKSREIERHQENNTTNNIVFTGSTTELLDMIRKSKKD